MVIGTGENSQSASSERHISLGQWNPNNNKVRQETGIVGKWIFSNTLGRSPITNEVLPYTSVYTLKTDGTVDMEVIDNRTNKPAPNILGQSDSYRRINGKIMTNPKTKELTLVFTEIPADQT